MFCLSSENDVLVNERKFVGSDLLSGFASALFDARCLPDAEYPFGHINSIYFDSYDTISFAEKLNGDNLKMKIRARWYGCPEENTDADIPVFLEIKYRLGSTRDKIRSRISAPGRWLSTIHLDDPSVPAFLYKHAAVLGHPIPQHWIPSVCISYDRRRYLCPVSGSRVAVDWNIRSERINAALFPCLAPVYLSNTICEFKNTTGEIPPWAEALYNAGFRLRSFSKYGSCLTNIQQGTTPDE